MSAPDPEPAVPPQPKPKTARRAATSRPARTWRLNLRAAIGLAVLLVVGLGIGIAAWALQTSRGRATLLTQARGLAAGKAKDDLALSYLKEYLAANPRDLEALDLRGEILARSARTPDQLDAIVKNGELILRLDPDATRPRGRAVRRRLVEAHLALGPMLAATERKYDTAERLAEELVADPEEIARARSGDGPRRLARAAPSATAADLRLHARALERLGVSGDRDRLAQAAARYEEARKAEPGDAEGASRLARLYQFDLKAPAKAAAVLDALIAAPPGRPDDPAGAAAEARAKAAAMIAKAVETAPKSLAVRLAAAEIAIADKKPVEAAAHLAQVAEADRKDFKFRTLEGLVALYGNRNDDAVESWSRGLKLTSGGDAELSWNLAYVLLHLGRLDEAAPLISQYRRNVGLTADGDVPPQARYLEALLALKSNRPARAVVELERAALTAPAGLRAELHAALGEAAEATRDEARAMEEYRQALLADPRLTAPRLARARLLQGRKPDEAMDELKAGLAAAEDASLLLALARLELARQLRLAPAARSWGAVDALLERARKVEPGAPALAVVRADKLSAQGSREAAADLLGQAVGLDKTSPELWAAHARKLVELGRLDRAVAALDRAMEPGAAGDQAALRILRAQVLTAQGHGAEARDGLVRDLDRVRPDQRPQLWRALGELYANQNDPAAARKAMGEWAALLPEDPLPRLAILQSSLADDSPEAEAAARRSLDDLKAIGGVYDLIGRAAYTLRDRGGRKEDAKARSGRLDEAEGLIAKIEKAAPGQLYAHLLRGSLEQQRDRPAKAAEAYERALRADGGLSALPLLVKLYGGMGRAGEEALARLGRDYPAAAVGIARAGAEDAARKGDKGRAEELARRVVAGAGDGPDARIWQAKILSAVGKPAEAEAILRGLIEAHPEDLGPRRALLEFQVARKDQKAAAATIEAMIARVKGVERPELVWAQAWAAAGDRDRADSAFEAALARWPDDPRVGRVAAGYYEASGRREKATAVFAAALERDAAQRWAARGLALLLSARPGDAAAWRKAWGLVKDPAAGGDLPEDRLARALVLARGPEAAGRDRAVAMLRKLVDDLPADLPAAATSRTYLAGLLIKDEPAKAAELAAPAALAPAASPAAQTLYVDALIAAKRLDDADRQLDRLAAAAPDAAAAATLRARLLRARGRGDQAAEALEGSAPAKIAGPDGEAAGRLIVRTLLNEFNRPEAAERVARLLRDKFPPSAGVLAAVVARRGRRDEALKLYIGEIEAGDPAHAREAARNALALIARDAYDPDAIAMAEKAIDSARAKDPGSPELLAMAGYIRHYQSRYEDEVKIYEDALAGRPDDFNLMNNMAWTLSEGLHRPEQALERINGAIAKSLIVPPQFYDTRGVILTRLGKYDDAIRDLKLAVRDRPTGTVWAHLARAYYKADRMADFKAARDQAKAAKPPLTPDMLEKADRAELEPLIFGDK